MPNTISHSGQNSGFQAGVVRGNIENVTIVQSDSETLNQECLRDLRITNPIDDKERIKNTKGGLLDDSYRWILDNAEFKQWHNSQTNRLLWIRGDPGKGKTMLLCGIIEELVRLYGGSADATISFFFCQATDSRINTATSVLRGLIYLLVEKHPSLLSHVRARYDNAGKSLFEDVNAWNALSAIFKDILKDPTLQAHLTYLVIDALDECTQGLNALLGLISQESSVNLQVKWVVSSRNWPEITERLNIASQLAPISLELNEASVSEAVNQFIRSKVRSLAETKRYSDKTRDTVHSYLLLNAQGTFLWVALVCQHLEKIRMHVLKKLQSFPAGLDALYERMVDQVRDSEDAQLCKQILAIMCTVFRPITIPELTSLIDLSDDKDDHVPLEEIIAICGSFLTLHKQTIVFVHQSAKDFLLKEAHVRVEIFPECIEAEHSLIFARSLDVLFNTLQRDIGKASPNALAAAEYACIYWIDHLQGSDYNGAPNLSIDKKGRVDAFLRQKFLQWLEALSILGSVSNGIQAVQKLEVLVKQENEGSNEGPEGLFSRVQDAYRFIRYFRTAIESSPLQVYYSPLVFGPSKSLTRMAFLKERPKWVLRNPIVEQGWSACLQTLEGHSGTISSIAWSPDGRQLASGSDDKTIRIWDPDTGQSISTLQGHSGIITSIAWSLDGCRLTSASKDKTVQIWDIATSQSISTLKGYRSGISSITWSPDRSRLASWLNGDDLYTVQIQDPVTGQTISTLQGHNDKIDLISWSPDSKQLASASSDKTVRIWDPDTSQSISTLQGHTDQITSITWSPDGCRLASGSFDGTVRIWDLNTGQTCTPILEGHGSGVSSVAWSPYGSHLASGSYDNMIHIWDPATGQIISTLEGHINYISSIAWSPDGSQLASGSCRGTVQIWDLVNSQSMSTSNLKGHSKTITTITWSPDGTQLASGSDDKTVQIWDPATGQSICTLKGHIDYISSIAWSPDGSQLASGSSCGTVQIWDLVNSQSMSTSNLKGHSKTITTITWSPDGTQLASGSDDKTVQIWDSATGQSISTLKGHSSSVNSIAWGPHWRQNQLASGSNDCTVRIWGLASQKCLLILEGHDHGVTSVSWSPDGSQLASGSCDNTIHIWDPATGQVISTLKGHIGTDSVAWSPDGNRLVSDSDEHAFQMWDVAAGQSSSILHGHDDIISSIAWSLDGSRLASGSYDKTVRIWNLASGQNLLTLPIGLTSFVEFDITDSNCLRTNVGMFDISSVDPTMTPTPESFTNLKLPKQYGYGLSNDRSWITYGELQLLWLPPDYRPRYRFDISIYANKIAIVCLSGRVIFLTLSDQFPIPAF